MPFNDSNARNLYNVLNQNIPTEKTLISTGVDLNPYYKYFSVYCTGGGRVTISYIPMRNNSETAITHEVYDGWVSDVGIRKLISATPVSTGTVTVFGLN